MGSDASTVGETFERRRFLIEDGLDDTGSSRLRGGPRGPAGHEMDLGMDLGEGHQGAQAGPGRAAVGMVAPHCDNRYRLRSGTPCAP
jgi:hypothetical protein